MWEILISRLRDEWADGRRAKRKTNVGNTDSELVRAIASVL